MGKRETRAAMNTRRSFLYTLGASLGSVAFSDLLAKETESPLAPKDPHLAPRAKACIFLVMEGGPSHIDTFDPKPKLEELHMKHFENVGEHFSTDVVGPALLRSKSLQVPQSGSGRHRHVRAFRPLAASGR